MSIRRPDMTPHKTPISELPAEIRIKNFLEVDQGYTVEEAKSEAERCMNCPERYCAERCPAHTAIPLFIENIRAGDYEKAYEIINATNPMAEIACRVCPYERQCESACTRGIKHEPVAIERLERFVCDRHRANGVEILHLASENVGSAAVVGSGPSGLCCALVLARAGMSVTIFEKSDRPGGILSWGIPSFVLPKALSGDLVGKLVSYGVKFKTGVELGKDMTLSYLRGQFDAVFLAVGAGKPVGFSSGERSPSGVMQAAEYLAAAEKPSARSVVVFGGGSTAIDVARVAVRTGAEKVKLIYRRSEEEMPATAAELASAKREGVEIVGLTNLAKFIESGDKLTGVECDIMSFVPPDYPGGRKNTVPSGEKTVVKADLAVLAFGFKNELIEGVEQDSQNRIMINEKYMTSVGGVFAGGDAVTGPSTVMKAASYGIDAAKVILKDCFAGQIES